MIYRRLWTTRGASGSPCSFTIFRNKCNRSSDRIKSFLLYCVYTIVSRTEERKRFVTELQFDKEKFANSTSPHSSGTEVDVSVSRWQCYMRSGRMRPQITPGRVAAPNYSPRLAVNPQLNFCHRPGAILSTHHHSFSTWKLKFNKTRTDVFGLNTVPPSIFHGVPLQ